MKNFKVSLKFFKLFVLLLFLTAFSGNVWGKMVSWSIADYASANSWGDGTKHTSFTLNTDITVSASGGGNTGNYYLTDNTWRLYESQSATLTISTTSGTINTIVITYKNTKSTYNYGAIYHSSDYITSGSGYDVSGTSVEFSVGHSSGESYGISGITAITVFYTPEGESSVFSRISSAGDLADGDEVIFVNQAETYACGATDNGNNRTPVTISVSDHNYTYSALDNVQIFTVREDDGNYGFHTGYGYIYSGSNNANQLKTNTTSASTAPSDVNAWNLSATDNVFTIQNATNTEYTLEFQGTSYFAQYKGTQTKPFIYKRQTTLYDYFKDVMHDNVVANQSGSYSMPNISDQSADATLVGSHYKFVGWVAEDEIYADGTLKSGYTLYIPGESHTADGTTYYAIWATDL